MVKRLAIAGVVLVVLAVALAVLPRAEFGSAAMRDELTGQLSRAVGLPVTAASIRASALWSVTITLEDVSIGQGSAVRIDKVHIRTGLLSLVTRRMANAALILEHVQAELPGPALAFAAREGAGSGLPTISTITFDDMELATRGRRIRIDAEAEPRGANGLAIERATLEGDDMRTGLTGAITDLSSWSGELTATGDALDGDVLLSLAWDLLDRPGASQPDASAAAPTDRAPLVINLEARRLTMGSLPVTDLKGRAGISQGVAALDPVSFTVLGGRYSGQMTMRFGEGEPSIRWYGDLSNVNLAAVTASQEGSPAISGLISGDVDLTGTGIDFTRAMKAARGSARITMANGSIGRLGLVRSVLAATSARPQEAARNPDGPADTAFKTLSSAMSISGGSASLIDLSLEGDDLALVGGGGLRLDGSAVTVFADLRLSEALSRTVAASRGRDLAPGARLSVPVTIRGNTNRYQIAVETQQMTAEGSASR